MSESSPKKTASWKDWHIPFSRDRVTLREAQASLSALGAKQDDIPLMIQLVENPRFNIPGFDIFHGAVDLKTHDHIHILLGRGLLSKDEAFTIGFTMGSTNKVTTLEENLYTLFSKHLYPKVYQFNDEDIHVFKDATKLGFISDCQPLDQIDYEKYLDRSLRDIRQDIGLESDLIIAYYRIEKRRYPKSKASRRLLD
ncbi:MAG: hypothetical protein HY735_09450 [Verrucomicrobia bacterium]|nr:hypothetical protein [Verrucomicrobiota bacterium]